MDNETMSGMVDEQLRGEYTPPGHDAYGVDVGVLVRGEAIVQARLSGTLAEAMGPALCSQAQSVLVGASREAPVADLRGRLAPVLASAQAEAGCAGAHAAGEETAWQALGGDASLIRAEETIAIAVRRALVGALSWTDIDFDVICGPMLDPRVNVALDETLAEKVMAGQRRPLMRLWDWEGTQVVIGSFQSYANELQPTGVDKHNVIVTRRISGGGAMYMEAGKCVTFSLIVPTALIEGMSFEQSYPYLDQWVMEVLASLGVNARYVPLNDIASDRGKIAGAAQKRWAKGFTLHHVTMAYDIDSGAMNEVLRIGMEKIRDKGTRSAAKFVDPLTRQIDLPRETVVEAFRTYFISKYSGRVSALTDAEIAEATDRVRTKFGTAEWTFRLP
ncbi:lipoate--protein ligase family protein [Schaalia suimastitidis]|uniref:lipoate--protein ligase family protein n=1 Tax=Schaalia suimastitidis TaxID=121163 RepID=UPI001F0A64E2|nr:biotin/lipoate A/B protein ligase family protein [Schaalia suimastitidis]